MIERATLKVAGMSCAGCENAIKRVLKQVNGVDEVSASHTEGTVEVTYGMRPRRRPRCSSRRSRGWGTRLSGSRWFAVAL